MGSKKAVKALLERKADLHLADQVPFPLSSCGCIEMCVHGSNCSCANMRALAFSLHVSALSMRIRKEREKGQEGMWVSEEEERNGWLLCP